MAHVAPAQGRPDAAIVRWIARCAGADRSTGQAIAVGACLTLLPSLLWASLLFGALDALGVDPASAARDDLTGSWRDWVAVVAIAPAIETLMLAGLLYFLRPLRSKLRVALASALAWGLLHALIAWGAVLTAWPFFVFSLIWLERRRLGFGAAFAATAGVHALHNAALFAMAGLSD